MHSDRYLRIILTIIAIELLWLGFGDTPKVAAQAEPARVIVASVDGGYLPVAIAGQTATAGQDPLRPIQVGIAGDVVIQARMPLKIEADRPLKVEADRPLPVESVPYTPGARPGE